MPDSCGSVTARVVERIADIPPQAWDQCAGDENPFVGHRFLNALEASGSARREHGWLPQHLILEDGQGRLLGAVPLYLKGHSYGEYVFDWGWADAFERAGGRYYPKLQAAIPFSPVSGPRLLVRPGPDAADTRRTLIGALESITERLDISSAHVTFCNHIEWEAMGAAGWIQRTGQQFHWHNQGYDSFEAFLDTLTSRKRKSIRKERREIRAQGITMQALSGRDIEAHHWDSFYRFYVDTYDRKWGQPYLTREFFDRLGGTMADAVVLILAEHDGVPIAGALNLRGTEALFGRNWGCSADYKFLHFEACYYQAIDYAIEQGLKRVEAGTQGAHKVQRGYVPVPTYSAHFIRNRGLSDAVAQFCREEAREIEREMDALRAESPYKAADASPPIL